MATESVQDDKAEIETTSQRFCVIISRASMDMAYPACMMATTAATIGIEAYIFFTFWGLEVLNKKKVGSLIGAATFLQISTGAQTLFN